MGNGIAAVLRAQRGVFGLLAFYLLLQAGLRCYFYTTVSHDIEEGTYAVYQSFFWGGLFDGAVFFFFWLPYFAVDFLVGDVEGRVYRSIYADIFIFFALVSTGIDYLFWQDFNRRINFLGWDYLAYPQEVTRHVMTAYPIAGTIAVLAVFQIVLFLLLYMLFFPFLFPRVRSGYRRVGAFCGVLLAASFALFLRQRYVDGGVNQYLNELAKNGIYSFFQSGLDYDMEYATYFDTIDEKRAAALIGSLLSEEGVRFDASGNERLIDGGGGEKHLNVVMVVMESMSTSFMGDLTPNLTTIKGKSLFCSKHFASGVRTVGGLETLSLSVPPGPGTSIIKRPNNGDLHSIGSVFLEKGYDVAFLYSGRSGFDNMREFFQGNGYRIVDRRDMDSHAIAFENVWGASDEDLFIKLLQEADGAYAQGVPFFFTAMTTSNHQPYSIPEGRIDLAGGTREAAVKYADFAIGELMRKSREKPWFSDTLFVFVSDHAADSFGNRELNPNLHRVPLIFFAPDHVEPRVIDRLSCHLDVAPTVAGILHFSYRSRFFGHNLLKSSRPYALLGSFDRLGFLSSRGLTVLRPGGGARTYDLKGRLMPAAEPDDVQFAKALYQTGSKWSRYQRQGQ